MAPKDSIFTKEKELELIDEVEKRPLLWDAKRDIYRRADLKPLAWEEIAFALGPPFTAELVAKRFKNMNENFARNLAKVKESKRKGSGSGYEDTVVPTWYLYQRLRFLEKSCNQSSSQSNLPTSEPSSSASTDVQFPLSPSQGSRVNVYYDENFQSFQLIPDDVDHCEVQYMESSDTLDQSFTSPVPSPMAPPARPSSAPAIGAKQGPSADEFFNKRGDNKKGKNANAKVLEKAVAVMQEIVNQPPPSVPAIESKPWDGICSFLASRLSSMTEEQRKRCENEILQVLLKY